LLKYLILSALLLILSCGTQHGDTWLIRTTGDTITVSEAGEAWSRLEQDERLRFLSGNNTVADFISELGRNTIVTLELSNEQYLYSSLTINMRDCWIRNASCQAYRDSLTTQIRQEITNTDIENYRKLLGSVVWYSTDGSATEGPVRLPDLPWPVAFAFDSMQTGSTILIDSIVYSLDSILTTWENPVDTMYFQNDRFAMDNLTSSRMTRYLNMLSNQSIDSLFIDEDAVFSYCANRSSVSDQAELAAWPDGVITAEDLDGILEFTSLGQQIFPESPEWVSRQMINQARLYPLTQQYSLDYPDDFTAIQLSADRFAWNQAYETLFRDNVTSRVVVTDSMTADAYLLLDSALTVPEYRTFVSVQVPQSSMDDAIFRAVSGNDALLEAGYSGYSEFLAHDCNFLSRPVSRTELPDRISDVLFNLEASDTAWQEPVQIQPGVFVFYKLHGIVPAHFPSLEQMKESIENSLLIHLEEQKTMEWICELEQLYSLEINQSVLGDLPNDPEAWIDL